jgi:hypothetical protein
MYLVKQEKFFVKEKVVKKSIIIIITWSHTTCIGGVVVVRLVIGRAWVQSRPGYGILSSTLFETLTTIMIVAYCWVKGTLYL